MKQEKPNPIIATVVTVLLMAAVIAGTSMQKESVNEFFSPSDEKTVFTTSNYKQNGQKIIVDGKNVNYNGKVVYIQGTDVRIDKTVLDATTRCINDFSCLSEDKTFLCDVVASNGEDIVEIKSQSKRPCRYCISLDSACYCHCPTRVAIYNRYKM